MTNKDEMADFSSGDETICVLESESEAEPQPRLTSELTLQNLQALENRRRPGEVHSQEQPPRRQHGSIPSGLFRQLSYHGQIPSLAHSSNHASTGTPAEFDTEHPHQPEASRSGLEEPGETGHSTRSVNATDSFPIADSTTVPPGTFLDNLPLRPELSDSDLNEDYVRCICGAKEKEQSYTMINCDGCTAWQHNICMGMPEEKAEPPEKYYCELCRPLDHHETLQALKRGERIWKTRSEKSWEGQVVMGFREKIQA